MNPNPITGCVTPTRDEHITWFLLLSVILVSLMLAVVSVSAVAAPFAITGASWSNGKLQVSGTGDKAYNVTVVNAYDIGQTIATSGITGKGQWATSTQKNSPPVPVPCRVRAIQSNGLTAEADVTDAPADCGPTPPPPANVPPTADAGGPYSGTTNSTRPVQFDGSGSKDTDGTITYLWDFGDGGSSTEENPTHPYATDGTYTVTLTVTDNDGASDSDTTEAEIAANEAPVANDETFVIDTTVVSSLGGYADVPRPGALLHDSDPNKDPLTATLNTPASNGTVVMNPDGSGSFTYTPNSNVPGTDSFEYTVSDGDLTDTATVALTVETDLYVKPAGQQNQFNIMMNYELGMHCTGFEFAYCCVLPPYNSILAQVVKTDAGDNDDDFPRLLEGDPNQNKDGLGRETVLRDPALDENGHFKKYVLRYWHDAQPRNDGRGKPQSSTLISAQELNSMFMWNTIYDVAGRDANGKLTTGEYAGYHNVPIGDGVYDEGGYANGWLNHLYIYQDLEGNGATGLDARRSSWVSMSRCRRTAVRRCIPWDR